MPRIPKKMLGHASAAGRPAAIQEHGSEGDGRYPIRLTRTWPEPALSVEAPGNDHSRMLNEDPRRFVDAGGVEFLQTSAVWLHVDCYHTRKKFPRNLNATSPLSTPSSLALRSPALLSGSPPRR